ncbi:MAG: glycosyltransferase [Methanomassiliicoccales archaeon]|jgi:1,2-diacylglycerol 3-alpha-glucosyltransferase|nr:glycosyltransferase [Methanomassiliicoccales archaeon]
MFTDSYLPTRDGVVTSLLLTKRELERMGHTVYVFAPDPADPSDREEGVHYFRSIGFHRYSGYRIPLFPTDKCHILEGLDVDLIHVHGLMFQAVRGMLAGRALRKPVVLTFHTMVTEAARFYNFTPFPEWVIQLGMWTYLRTILHRAEVVIAPTVAIKNELKRYAPHIKRLEVIPTGVDLDRFNPRIDGSEVRRRYGLEGKKVILHLGRIAWEKNIDLVVRGFALLSAHEPEARLLLVGEGPAKEHVRGLVKELGIEERVIFTGFVPDPELPQFYAACDVLTLASKFETQGLVILEAMAVGKPVSGIRYRAVAELVREGENGELFEETPYSWSQATLRLLRDPERYREGALAKAREFSAGQWATRLVDVYRYAIEAKAGRANDKAFLKR